MSLAENRSSKQQRFIFMAFLISLLNKNQVRENTLKRVQFVAFSFHVILNRKADNENKWIVRVTSCCIKD